MLRVYSQLGTFSRFQPRATYLPGGDREGVSSNVDRYVGRYVLRNIGYLGPITIRRKDTSDYDEESRITDQDWT